MLNRIGEQYIGKIVSFSDRRPVSGVRVRATNQQTNSIVEVATDVNGDYALALSPNALYVIRYSRPGYRDFNRTVKTTNILDPSLLGVVSILPSTGTVTDTGNPNVNPGGNVTTPQNPGIGSTPGGISPTSTGSIPPTNPGGNGTISSGYAIQIAALSSPRLEEFSSLSNLGKIYSREERNIHKIRLGIFRTRQEAERALSLTRSSGYPEAFIVPENGGPNVAAVNPQTGTTSAIRGNTSANSFAPYKVQLGAYRDTRWFDGSKLQATGGVVEDLQKGGLTVKLLGGFTTLTQAQNALRTALNAGFSGAFIVREEGGQLIKVN